jgi:hypothetical protein
MMGWPMASVFLTALSDFWLLANADAHADAYADIYAWISFQHLSKESKSG